MAAPLRPRPLPPLPVSPHCCRTSQTWSPPSCTSSSCLLGQRQNRTRRQDIRVWTKASRGTAGAQGFGAQEGVTLTDDDEDAQQEQYGGQSHAHGLDSVIVWGRYGRTSKWGQHLSSPGALAWVQGRRLLQWVNVSIKCMALGVGRSP